MQIASHASVATAGHAAPLASKLLSGLVKIANEISKALGGVFQRLEHGLASLGSQLKNKLVGQAAVHRANEMAEDIGRQFGQRFAAQAPEGTTLHGYRILGDKVKGVEPGFVALKDWSPQDDTELQQSGQPLHTAGCAWIIQQSAADPPQYKDVGDFIERAIGMQATYPGGVSDADLDILRADPSGKSLSDWPNKELQKNVASMALVLVASEAESDKPSIAYQDLKKHLMAGQLKFTEKHYIKLDYYEANRSLMGKYTLPSDKAKDIAGIPVLGKILHQLGKLETPKEINRGAVYEKMSNDLMQAMGLNTQTLEIVEGKYADGTPKLLLDSTHIQDFNDFDGAKNATKGAIYIKDGVLVKNTRLPSDPPGQFNGPPRLHTEIQAMGRNKIKMLLLADRDALGSKGANKGYANNQFFAIDPGHALNHKLLKKRDDVHSDLSFDPASRIKSMDYKNFSIFDQCTFAEKMEGVRDIQKMKETGADTQIFDQYIHDYSDPKSDALNFKENLIKTKEMYLGRRDNILDIFASRLAVDHYSFGADIDNDPERKRDYRDQTLNLLDGLEKLTSQTVGTANGEDDGIALAMPKVKARSAWDVKEDKKNIIFTMETKGEAGDAKAERIADDVRISLLFLNHQSQSYMGHTDRHKVVLRVPKDQILQVQSALSYEKIMNFKHNDD